MTDKENLDELLKKDGMKIEGYKDKDKPKPCPLCKEGMVRPLWNAKFGRCNKCRSKISWKEILKKEEKLLVLLENWNWLYSLVKPEVRDKVNNYISSLPWWVKGRPW